MPLQSEEPAGLAQPNAQRPAACIPCVLMGGWFTSIAAGGSYYIRGSLVPGGPAAVLLASAASRAPCYACCAGLCDHSMLRVLHWAAWIRHSMRVAAAAQALPATPRGSCAPEEPTPAPLSPQLEHLPALNTCQLLTGLGGGGVLQVDHMLRMNERWMEYHKALNVSIEGLGGYTMDQVPPLIFLLPAAGSTPLPSAGMLPPPRRP